jgi:hypothetical protein
VVIRLRIRLFWIGFLAVCCLLAAFVFHPQYFPGGQTLFLHLRGKKTVDDRVQEYGAAARSRIAPYFRKAGVLYPPQKVILVGLKREKRLEIYAGNADGAMKFVRTYRVLAASGHAGPKLREGDLQVPEGFYRIESLNPNSAFHLALRVNYPNEFDRENAAHEGRTELGGDIMIHGSNASIGCLAMGDAVAEELFVLAADAGLENIEVLLCPADFRVKKVLPPPGAPPWTAGLYQRLAASLRILPRGESAH